MGMTKMHWDFLAKAGVTRSLEQEETFVGGLVNNLLSSLYIPVESSEITRIDRGRKKLFGLDDDEPVNWGSLHCNTVKKFADGSYLAIIDEASPGQCPKLCGYIERFMKSWGWDLKVETEW